MKPSVKLAFVLILLLVLGSSAYLGLRQTASDPEAEQEHSITEPPSTISIPVPLSHGLVISSRRSSITLEEAMVRTGFRIPVPTYLPKGMSLAGVEVEELSHDRFYLYFSDGSTQIYLQIDHWLGAWPSDDDIEAMASPTIWIPPGTVIKPFENIFKVVSFKGIKGIGRDLGHQCRLQGPLPAHLVWWNNGLRFALTSSTHPLDELIKIAESMVVRRPAGEGAPPYAVSISIAPQDGEITPGARLYCIARVTNGGRLADNYALSVSDALGWDLGIYPSSLAIPPGESRFAMISVAVPENALPGLVNDVTVTATSSTDSTIGKSFKFVVKVEGR